MTLCRHFGTCGGCALQNLTTGEYRDAKRALVEQALARAGLGDVRVEDPLLAPPHSRRRAVFKLAKAGDVLEIGFHAARSHAIVDMCECRVLTPALFALVDGLRAALAPLMHAGEKAELHAGETQAGFDLGLRWERKLTPALTAAIAGALSALPVARLVFNQEILLEMRAPKILFDGIEIAPPPYAFLQPSAEGEAMLRNRVLALTKGAKAVLDLFAGLGTFALPLARHAKVHAVEQDGAALAALAMAARNVVGGGASADGRRAGGLRPITTEKRDLFKLPLSGAELAPYGAAVLDPPRAGAQAQARALAASKMERIAYVSCDAASFARDARILVDGGFRLGPVTPVDQFVYSNHIELVAGFRR